MCFPEGQIRVHLYGYPCDMNKVVRWFVRADPTGITSRSAERGCVCLHFAPSDDDEGSVFRPLRILHLGEIVDGPLK